MAGIVLLHGDPGTRPPARLPRNHMLGVSFALAAIGMLFMGLASSYIVRQGLGGDWKAIPMPRVLQMNTLVLLLSSATLEKARLSHRSKDRRGTASWLAVTLTLGLAFLAGQLAAWRMLSAQGFYLSTNPHSSFFYVLTGLHGLHFAGGLLALAWTALAARGEAPARAGRWLDSTALYWHSMDALWVLLLALLFVWG